MVIKYIETTAVGIYYIFIILFALLQYLYHLDNRYVLLFSDQLCTSACDKQWVFQQNYFNIFRFVFRRLRKSLPVWKHVELFPCSVYLQKLVDGLLRIHILCYTLPHDTTLLCYFPLWTKFALNYFFCAQL